MGKLRTYIGNNISRNYIGGNVASQQGDFPAALDPSTIAGLRIWFDATKNTVTTNGSDEILSITNSGTDSGTFSFYPPSGGFGSPLKANFVQGTGDTRYYFFWNNESGYMSTVWRNVSFTPKTIISIAKKVFRGYEAPLALWNMTKNVGTLNGILHPPGRDALGVSGSIDTFSIVSPDVSLGDYVYGESDFTFFAWSSPNYYSTAGSKMQTNKTNSTSATYSNTPSGAAYNQFVINVGEDLSPGAFSTGQNAHVAEMVYDTVLTPNQIAGIYKYYTEVRGYTNIK